MKFSFSNKEKLKSKKHIDVLFTEGKSCSKYPLKMIYTTTDFIDDVPIKAGVSVSKRNFKKAVDRNKVKRILRECYRLNKHIIFNDLDKKYVCMFLYLGREIPKFHDLNQKMERLLLDFKSKEINNTSVQK